jgi:hypothetical protein
MSTHPSDAQRIADIQRFLPEALRYYNPSGAAAATTTTKKGAAKKTTTPKTTKTIRIK